MTTARKSAAVIDVENEWVKAQQETAKVDDIHAALIVGERSGPSARGPEEIREAAKTRMRNDILCVRSATIQVAGLNLRAQAGIDIPFGTCAARR